MRIAIVDVCNPFEEAVASLRVQRTFRSIHHDIILKNYFVRSYMRNTVFFLPEIEYLYRFALSAHGFAPQAAVQMA